MKIHVEHDEFGTVNSVSLIPQSSEGGGRSARVRRPGYRVTELDMPETVAELAAQLESGVSFNETHVHQLRTLIAQFRLDTTNERPKFVRR